MRPGLAIIAGRDLDALELTLRSVEQKVWPPLRSWYIHDAGAKIGRRRILDLAADIGTPSVVEVAGKRRRASAPEHTWQAIATFPCTYALLIPTAGVRFLRRIDLATVENILDFEPSVLQVAFPDGRDLPRDRYELRGSAVSWLQHSDGFIRDLPSVVRVETARQFGWDDLDFGLRGALPDATFAVWGNGEAWVADR